MELDELKPQEETNCDLGNMTLKKSDLENDSYCARQKGSQCDFVNKLDRDQDESEHKEQSIKLKKLLKTGTSLNELEEKLEALETSYGTKDERLNHQPRVSADQCLTKAEVVDTTNSVQTMSNTSKSGLLGTNSDEHTLSQYELCDSSDDQQQPRSLGYERNIDGSTCSKTEEKENFNSYPGTSSASMQENTRFEIFLKLPSPPSSLPNSSSSSHCSGSDNIDSLNESGSSSQQPDVAAKHTFKRGATVSAPEGRAWERSERKQLHKSASFPLSGSSARSHSNSSSYIYSSASVTSLPSTLQLFDDNTHIVWPLQETLSVEKGPEGEEEYTEGKQWLVLGSLGEGAFGSCDLARDLISEKLLCVKKCQYRHDEVLPMYLAAKKSIPEIVEFFGAIITGKTVCIFMEVLDGNLNMWLSSQPF